VSNYSEGTGDALPEGAFATDPVTATVDKAWGWTVGDESWGEFTTPGGTGSQIADPLDLFGFQAGKDAADAAKAQAEAQQIGVETQYIPIEVEAKMLGAISRGARDNTDFEQRAKVAELALKEADIESNEKIAMVQMATKMK